MGRDAQGHGHNAGEPGNPNHGAHGRFSSGSGGDSSGGKSGRAPAVGKQKWSKPHVTEAKSKWKTPHVTEKQRAHAAAHGDHQRAQVHFGHGYPVTSHAGVASVGTSGGGGGGGGGSAGGGDIRGMNVKPTKTTKGLSKAAQEKIAQNEQIDERHYPTGDMVQPVVAGYRRGTRNPTRGMNR